MNAYACPICQKPWRSDTSICAACGADLYDPDVQALAGQAFSAGDSLRMAAAEAGALSVGKILGLRQETLVDGSGLRKLAGLGGVLLLLAFVAPALREFDFVWRGDHWKPKASYFMSWELLRDGPVVALLYPLLAGLVGLAVALVPRLSGAVRGQILAATGLIGVVLCLGPLGDYGYAPTQAATLTTLGVVVAGVSIAARMLLPHSMPARWGLVAGGGLFLLGLLIPAGDLSARLPFEYLRYSDYLELEFEGTVPLIGLLKGIKPGASEVLFMSAWHLLPLFALPAAAIFAWRKPGGVWDKGGYALRPLAWVLVLYIPLTYALYTFMAVGGGAGGLKAQQQLESALIGRARLGVISFALLLWAQFGLLAALIGQRKAGAPATAQPLEAGAVRS